jgi:hypothetical protein
MPDIERQPSLARVSIELPRQHVPELMTLLGEFVVNHDAVVGVAEAQQRLPEAELIYEQSRATLLPDPASGELIPTVTTDKLNSFLLEMGRKPGPAERVINALGMAAGKHRGLQPLLIGAEHDFGFSITGIRVDSIRNIIDILKAEPRMVRGVGAGSIGLLEGYCSVLFPET